MHVRPAYIYYALKDIAPIFRILAIIIVLDFMSLHNQLAIYATNNICKPFTCSSLVYESLVAIDFMLCYLMHIIIIFIIKIANHQITA